jgi:hypothetical protein
MKNYAVAFRFLEEGECITIGSQWIPFHMIFHIKCGSTHKARIVAGGHCTDAPNTITYSSVVTRESAHIGLLIAALNELDILAADIGNTYLQAPAREKVHTTAGQELGPNHVGKTVIIICAIYGFKSSGAAWHTQLSQTLRDVDFKPSLANPAVWMQLSTKDCGFKYYKYILVYVDDLLVISHALKPIMEMITKAYHLKDESTKPKNYQGSTIRKWSLPNEIRTIWSMNRTQYIKEATQCLE